MADFNLLRRAASDLHDDDTDESKMGYGGKFHQRGQKPIAKEVTQMAYQPKGRRSSYQMADETVSQLIL